MSARECMRKIIMIYSMYDFFWGEGGVRTRPLRPSRIIAEP